MPRKREALTQARQRGAIRTWGDPELAAALAHALDVQSDGRRLSHGFHSYPARMHPDTAERALALLDPRRVLDPFCGSGTVLVEAARRGAQGIGVDASPLAQLIAKAKTWRGSRRQLVETSRAIADDVLAEGKAARRSGWQAPNRRVNAKRDEALRPWLAPHVRAELEAILARVDETGDLQPILRAVLSSLLVKVSKRASDTRGELVERTIGRGQAARLFADKAAELARGLDALWKDAPRGTHLPRIMLGDARALPKEVEHVDAAVSSPPYAGTYDYLEHQRLRLAFLDIDEGPLAKAEIGARRDRGQRGWKAALEQVFRELARVLVPDGRAALLVGDSVADGVAYRADAWVQAAAATAGMRVVAGASGPRQALGQLEQRAFSPRRKEEHLLLVTRGG
jgi:SAM-dependent methyltransferase